MSETIAVPVSYTHLDVYKRQSLARQGLASLATVCLNVASGGYGDAAIAAMSIVSRIMQMAGSAIIGFGQGFQPICGFNYGAKLYGRCV